jgi:hypothetical protein
VKQGFSRIVFCSFSIFWGSIDKLQLPKSGPNFPGQLFTERKKWGKEMKGFKNF